MKKLMTTALAVTAFLITATAWAELLPPDPADGFCLVAGGGGQGKSAVIAGDLLVKKEEGWLKVKFAPNPDWRVDEAHLEVVCKDKGDFRDWPENTLTNTCNPRPGQFSCSSYNCDGGYVLEEDGNFFFKVPFPKECEVVRIGAHAVVFGNDGYFAGQEETAWAGRCVEREVPGEVGRFIDLCKDPRENGTWGTWVEPKFQSSDWPPPSDD